jgi:hypothetical protein
MTLPALVIFTLLTSSPAVVLVAGLIPHARQPGFNDSHRSELGTEMVLEPVISYDANPQRTSRGASL